MMWLPIEMSKKKKENDTKKIHCVCPYKKSFRYTSVLRKNKYLQITSSATYTSIYTTIAH